MLSPALTALIEGVRSLGLEVLQGNAGDKVRIRSDAAEFPKKLADLQRALVAFDAEETKSRGRGTSLTNASVLKLAYAMAHKFAAATGDERDIEDILNATIVDTGVAATVTDFEAFSEPFKNVAEAQKMMSSIRARDTVRAQEAMQRRSTEGDAPSNL